MSIEKTKKTIVSTGLICLDAIARDDSYWLMAGGSALNPLLILHSWGWDCYPVGRIGRGAASNHIISDINQFMMKADFIDRDESVKTPIYVMETKGSTHIFHKKCPKCSSPFTKISTLTNDMGKQVLGSLPDRIDVCLIERLSLFAVELVKHCLQKNTLVVFEPNRIEEPELLDEILPYVHIIKYSEEKIPLLTVLETKLNKHKVNVEIQTLGKSGLRFRTNPSNDQIWINVPSVNCDHFIDASGAGDWTTSSMLDLLFHTHSIDYAFHNAGVMEHILQKAQTQAAKNCGYPAPRSQMYDEKEIGSIHKKDFCKLFCKDGN